jgi:hypothetical protein
VHRSLAVAERVLCSPPRRARLALAHTDVDVREAPPR